MPRCRQSAAWQSEVCAGCWRRQCAQPSRSCPVKGTKALADVSHSSYKNIISAISFHQRAMRRAQSIFIDDRRPPRQRRELRMTETGTRNGRDSPAGFAAERGAQGRRRAPSTYIQTYAEQRIPEVGAAPAGSFARRQPTLTPADTHCVRAHAW